ncbi:MAG: hypothetical protein CME64_05940 [Halobacteriovoraceae bacterium]|nr:hypothetical protein [Halobacteriovoraceae bacterium]|tara:strand:+ start:153989 stop:154417 length:429 start_codon:yes stop_codon:yes gene_type:complete
MHEQIIIVSMASIWLLKVIVMMKMFLARSSAIKRGEVRLSIFRTYEKEHELSPKLLQASRNYKNLFEAPCLFYAVSLLIIVIGLGDLFTSVLAVTFAVSRYVHSYIHLGTNNVVHRMYFFAIGIFSVHVMWIYSLGKYFLQL